MRDYLRRLAELQSRIMLAVVYLLVVAPIWVFLRVTRKRLLDGSRPRWHSRRRETASVSSYMREPF